MKNRENGFREMNSKESVIKFRFFESKIHYIKLILLFLVSKKSFFIKKSLNLKKI